MIFQCSTKINKPVSEVYRFTINPDNLPKWLSNIQQIEYTKGCPGKLGCKTRYIYQEKGEKIILEDELIDLTQDKEIKRVLSYMGIKMYLTNHFIDDGNNTMTLISTTDMQLKNFILQCYNWLNKTKIQHQYQKDYLKLKNILEHN